MPTNPGLPEFIETVRGRGIPIVGVTTPDVAEAIQQIVMAEGNLPTPIIVWDAVEGVTPGNDYGKALIASVFKSVEVPSLVASLKTIKNLDIKAQFEHGIIVIIKNAARFIREDNTPLIAAHNQAVWNLREPFKGSGSTLILLSNTSLSIPSELTNDVVCYDEPLPSPEELSEIYLRLVHTAGWSERVTDEMINPKNVDAATRAMIGLSAFAAENTVAMALELDGVNFPKLWERKKRMLRDAGLTMYDEGQAFDQLGGIPAIKSFLRAFLKSKYNVGAVGIMDEVEKMMAGAFGGGRDGSGVSSAFLQQFLTFMQDSNAQGILLLGVPGAGKSAIGKALGVEAGIPSVLFDMSAMKGSLVGESEARLRNSLKTLHAVGNGRILMVLTCNDISNIPPEVLRRCNLGTWVFDLPDSEEKMAIWDVYFDKYPEVVRPKSINFDNGWTGAEIRQCVTLADSFGISVQEAAKYIVPVSISKAEEIQRLRTQAAGRYLSASCVGIYTGPQETGRTDGGQRQMRLARRDG